MKRITMNTGLLVVFGTLIYINACSVVSNGVKNSPADENDAIEPIMAPVEETNSRQKSLGSSTEPASPKPLEFGAPVGNLEPITRNADVAKSMNLLARIYLENGNVVEWYEPSPGSLVMSEIGTPPNMPSAPALSHLPPSEVFAKLKPDVAVPQRLRQAEARMLKAVGNEAFSLRSAQSPEAFKAVSPQASTVLHSKDDAVLAPPCLTGTCCDFDWFSNAFCGVNWDWQSCQTRLGDVFETCHDKSWGWDNVNGAHAAQCPFTGDGQLWVQHYGCAIFGTLLCGQWKYHVPNHTYRWFGWSGTADKIHFEAGAWWKENPKPWEGLHNLEMSCDW